jgi:hypothetical protein
MPHPIGFSLIIKHIGSTGGAHFVVDNDIALDAHETFTNTWSWNPDDGVAFGSSRLGFQELQLFLAAAWIDGSAGFGKPSKNRCREVKMGCRAFPGSAVVARCVWNIRDRLLPGLSYPHFGFPCIAVAVRFAETGRATNGMPCQTAVLLGISPDGMVSVTES